MHQVRKVTLQDVADRAGVSLTTASQVVNEGTRRVGPGLAQRVNQAVADLGYTANLQARAVATGQSTMIGVVVHDIADPYFSSIAAGLIEVADARQLLVCMSSTAATEAAERQYVALMRAQRARAVILIGSRTDDTAAREALRAEIAAFTRSGGRAVAVGQDLLGVDTVLPENAVGAEALARLRAGGLQVPADIALAGFDDIGTLRDVYPPLTTVRLPLKRMGEMAAGLVLAESSDPAAEPQPRVVPVPGEVILRESTRPHPPAR